MTKYRKKNYFFKYIFVLQNTELYNCQSMHIVNCSSMCLIYIYTSSYDLLALTHLGFSQHAESLESNIIIFFGLSKAAPKNVCSAETQRKDPHSYHLVSWPLGISLDDQI